MARPTSFRCPRAKSFRRYRRKDSVPSRTSPVCLERARSKRSARPVRLATSTRLNADRTTEPVPHPDPMTPIEGPRDISGLIAAWGSGDEEALQQLDACRLSGTAANRQAAPGPPQAGHTLESAALANEAYLKLVRAGGIRCESRVHFLALCSQIIRRILVDHARSRGYAKRGGDAVRVTLDDVLLGAQARGIEVLALDEALQSLSKIDAAKAEWWSCVTSAG